jgi:hypothetical protein
MAVKLGLSYCGEKHTLRLSEKRVLRRVFGPGGGGEGNIGLRKLHNEELHDLYFSHRGRDEKCIQNFSRKY